MLRINTGCSAAAAANYFQTLEKADHAYHIEGSEPPGVWGGRGAVMLGLSGAATLATYSALANNRHPDTGLSLTPRTKLERRAMYDFTFSVPKPVSLLHAFVDPAGVQSVFKEAVDQTMREMEAAAATRVRRGNQNHDRTTGNLVWATYVHRTTRPVGGTPDPHLHAHVCVFNQTFDAAEKRWKAVQLGDVKRNAPLYEALFLSHVVEGLEARGYRIEGDDKSWRVVGIPDSLSMKFSRRTQLIEKSAAALGINSPEQKADLGRRTRERKGPPTAYGTLQDHWRAQLTIDEAAALNVVKQNPEEAVRAVPARPVVQVQEAHRATNTAPGQDQTPRRPVLETPAADARGGQKVQQEQQVAKRAAVTLSADARRAIDVDINALLERDSVVPELKLIRTVLLRHPGKFTKQQVDTRLDERDDLIRREHGGIRQITSRAALDEERRMVRLASEGRGQCEPLSRSPWGPAETKLNPAQAAAVRHILSSGDRVTLVHGGTSEGKLDVIQQAALAARKCGHLVRVFAPTADAARGQLRADGFVRPDTVAKLLSDKSHEARSRGAVWFVDDAGQLGNQQMTSVLKLAKKCDARVVLVGDVRQRFTFGRGEALRVLSQYAGLRPAGLSEVFRQRGHNRNAIDALSAGNAKQAVEHLSAANSIQVDPTEGRSEQLARRFVDALKRGRTAIAIATSRDERERISRDIRLQLKEAGALGKSRRFEVLRSAGLDRRERGDASRYERGMVVQFARPAGGIPELGWSRFRAGERVTVIGRDPFGHVLVTGGGQLRTLPLRQAERFEVYRKSEIEIAKGDTIRVTRSGYFDGGPVRPKWDRNRVIDKLNVRYARKRSAQRLVENGALLRVRGFTARGDIKLAGGRTIPKDFAHVDHGYCLSPHAARTRTAHEVFVSMPSWSLGDDAREQLRSVLGRARDQVTVFTDDRDALTQRLARTPEHLSAKKVVAEGHLVQAADPQAVVERVRLHREAVNEARRLERIKRREREAERA